MSSAKEIRNKIFSVENINKVTKTMEMISISKIKKIKFKIDNRFPYKNSIKRIINNIISCNLEYTNKYLINNSVIKNICIIIISTDKGLCGSLNINLFKKILEQIKKFYKFNIKLIVIGKKGINFFKSMNNNFIIKNFSLLEFSLSKCVTKILDIIIDMYNKKKFQKFFLASNKFINSMNFTPNIFQLLPFYNKNLHVNVYRKFSWDYIYEPNSKFLLKTLFKKYLRSILYCKILENLYCEHSSRFFSMKQSSDNINNIIKKLKLTYNKSRQFTVTKEIIEIVSGYLTIS
ncbi:ATP synthase F1 subunit gamma [Buchnera aphidicola]|uniref:ATP synthase F1 subunit gamma n=1 Tax=Buchnera aphidicola TaxID=9 RepID=UPI0031B841E8